jgi:integrase
MSIEKRADTTKTTYRVRWREGKQARARNFPTYDMAVAFEAERIRTKYMGGFAPGAPSGETIGAWLQTWQDRYGSEWAQTTRHQRRDVLGRWVTPIIGHVPLRDFGPARAAAYRADLLSRGASPKTVNGVISVLSAAMGRAVSEQRIPSNPVTGLRSYPSVVLRPRALTPVEVEAIRQAMPTDRDRLVVSVLAYAGLRPGECVALVWGNVTPVSLIVDRSAQYGQVVPTKTRRVRTVPLQAPLRDDLAATTPGRPGDLVVPGAMGGVLTWRNWVRRVWAPATQAAGVRAVPYDLRHTFASLLIHEGVPVTYVSAALGHASPRMTLDRYAHVFDNAHISPLRSLADAVTLARQGMAGQSH